MSQSLNNLRQDITGLRAVAVMAVTLYHVAHVLDPENNLFKGGFLGVDIFFVISGFLMTKIIMTGLERGNFGLYTFYKRRAKRICPALLVTVVTFVAVAVLIFDTGTLLKTCRDGLRALGFISNYWLSRQTGYFDGPAIERVFLHTWSLSVEWQFYLIYPLLLMVAVKFLSKKTIGRLIVVLTLASLIHGCLYTLSNPVNSYFYLTSRAYELLIGALAYFYPLSYFLKRVKVSPEEEAAFQAKAAKQVEYLGLLCIAVSLFIVDSSAGWPNAWSILPLIGTYLCIAANNQQTLLRNVVMQKLGLWSYAIYLVHWPLIVCVSRYNPQGISWELLPIILLLGVALHYGVERRRNFGWIFLAFYFACTGAVQYIIKTEGSLFRGEIIELKFPGGDQYNSGLPFAIGNKSRPVDFILVGDSYARHYIDFLKDQDIHAVTLTLDGCFSSKAYYNDTFSDDAEYDKKCRDRYLRLKELVLQYPDVPVIWGQNWPEYDVYPFISRENSEHIENDTQDLLKAALSKDIPLAVQDLLTSDNSLYILGKPRAGDSNISKNFGQTCYTLFKIENFLSFGLMQMIGCNDLVPFIQEPELNIELKSIIDNLPQNQVGSANARRVIYIDPANSYCNEQGCRVMQPDTFEPYFFDGGHFSKYGSIPTATYILEQVQKHETQRHQAD